MGQGLGRHRPLPGDRDRGRAHPASADHPDQCLLRRQPRRGAGARRQVSGPEMAVNRQPLPFLRRPPFDVKGYESYGKMAKTYAKINDSAEAKAKATDFYLTIQIV